jgi:hypothetical protein
MEDTISRQDALDEIKRFFEQLFCRHEYEITRWHWFHGFNGNEPRRLEVERVCKKCGKAIYSYPDRNSKEETYILSMPEKEW